MKVIELALGWLRFASYAPSPPRLAAYPESVPLDLSSFVNNIAVGPNATFDQYNHGSYPPEHLPKDYVSVGGTKFVLPKWDGKEDNVVSDSQNIFLDPALITYAREMQILYAGDWNDGESGGRFTFNFADGSRQTVEVSVHNWWTLHWLNVDPAISAPYHYNADGSKNYNRTSIYTWSTAIRSSAPLTSITLPPIDTGNRLHIFAISLTPAVLPPSSVHSTLDDKGDEASLHSGRFTTRWRRLDSGVKAFAIEFHAANVLPTVPSLLADKKYWVNQLYFVYLIDDILETVVPGSYARLAPGDDVKFNIWVAPREPGSLLRRRIGQSSMLQVRREDGSVVAEVDAATALQGPEPEVDLLKRDTPEWFEHAKFGMFMHWGIYAVPGWGPPGSYAEWYWWRMHNPPDSSNAYWNYHLEHYGKDFVYDDFIPQFGSKFNASKMMGIIASSGAQYFVPTTKHHDGFAIFDTLNSTHRSSVYLGPQRDFLGELFTAAKNEQPHIHRGTYFSMPEWFNPDAGEGGYGFGTWPGQLARNAYDSSKAEPYTGRLEGKDYLRDVQLAQMKILAERYETTVMWCDIGGPNLTKTFVEEWIPFADSKDIQYAMNNRCGTLPQFDTPEYATFSSIQTQKWESSESVDPASYGYNRATTPEQYRSPEYLLHSLIDIVSKNGNYLLNIGPDGDGIIPQPVVDRLETMGAWLKHSGECIYDTDYFYPGAELDTLRFTRTLGTFCIISLARPTNGVLILDTALVPVPLLVGDDISLLGAGAAGADLKWSLHEGKVAIQVSDEALNKVDIAWAFQVRYTLSPA